MNTNLQSNMTTFNSLLLDLSHVVWLDIFKDLTNRMFLKEPKISRRSKGDLLCNVIKSWMWQLSLLDLNNKNPCLKVLAPLRYIWNFYGKIKEGMLWLFYLIWWIKGSLIIVADNKTDALNSIFTKRHLNFFHSCSKVLSPLRHSKHINRIIISSITSINELTDLSF